MLLIKPPSKGGRCELKKAIVASKIMLPIKVKGDFRNNRKVYGIEIIQKSKQTKLLNFTSTIN